MGEGDQAERHVERAAGGERLRDVERRGREGDQAERRRKTGREAGEREIRLRDVERRGERT